MTEASGLPCTSTYRHFPSKRPRKGIFKGFGDDDHVVTVHGFMDDLNICMKLAAKLNEEEPGAYRCVPLVSRHKTPTL